MTKKSMYVGIAMLLLYAAVYGTVNAATMLVGWDGADYRVVKKLSDDGLMPNLNRLTWGHLTITSVTMTNPSWSEQLSGLPWYVTGIIDNVQFRPIPAGKTVFEWAGAFGLKSAFISGKVNPMPTTSEGTYANIAKVATIIVRPYKSIEEFGDICLEAASTHNFVFCHSKQPDRNGHLGGMYNGKYVDKLLRLDFQLGRYLDAGHTVLLTSDHGFDIPTVSPNVPEPVYGAIGKPYGYNHVAQPNAIIGSNMPIDLSRPIGLDVFPTVVDMLGLPEAWWTPKGLGKSLVIE